MPFSSFTSQMHSIFKVSVHSYPTDSLPKSYRIGNRLLRKNYCDEHGIPISESTLFSNTNDPQRFQNMDEHIKIHSLPSGIEDLLILNSQIHHSKRLNADIFYKPEAVEPQKTPHSCEHAAKFMTLDYARTYYRKKTDIISRNITKHLSKYATTSGYDDGVGPQHLSIVLKKLGLFKKSKPADYGLAYHISKTWPNNLKDLAQHLAYTLFYHGPITFVILEPDTSYGHGITLMGIIQEGKDPSAQVIYADPWDGEMHVKPIDEFANMLYAWSKKLKEKNIDYYHVPRTHEASFFRRLKNNLHDMKIDFADEFEQAEARVSPHL